jgi:hypothetical protein
MTHLSTRKTEVVAVKEKALQVAAKQRHDLFQSDRENDQLNAALSNPERTRHICGIGSQMPWKHDLLKVSTSYKNVIGTLKPLKRRLKRRPTRSLRTCLWRSYKILAKKIHHSISQNHKPPT